MRAAHWEEATAELVGAGGAVEKEKVYAPSPVVLPSELLFWERGLDCGLFKGLD